jgi:hypothetical protein
VLKYARGRQPLKRWTNWSLGWLANGSLLYDTIVGVACSSYIERRTGVDVYIFIALVSNLQILIVSGAVEISIANMTQADRSQTEEAHTFMLLGYSYHGFT